MYMEYVYNFVVKDKISTHALLMAKAFILDLNCLFFIVHNESVNNHVL